MNEWTASGLALLAGFDALPVAQIRWEGHISVGWPLIDAGNLALGDLSLDSPDYDRCQNASRLPYQAAVLDAWLANPDRNAGNILAVRQPARALLIDHDRACFDRAQYRGNAGLRALTLDPIDGWVPGGTAWTVEEASWRHGVISPNDLDAAIARCQAVEETDIAKIVAMAPDGWASDADKTDLLEFILVRQERLKVIMQAWKQTFDGLIQWN
jgi:hypothetical protein